jgi:hypothetical protein
LARQGSGKNQNKDSASEEKNRDNIKTDLKEGFKWWTEVK